MNGGRKLFPPQAPTQAMKIKTGKENADFYMHKKTESEDSVQQPSKTLLLFDAF